MKESMWGYLLIVLGVIIIIIIVLIQNITNTQEEDYYLTREVLEASMIDAIDMGSFKSTGEIVMVKEKFVEVFIRRFAESVGKSKEQYTLEFYDINEYPPKASVRILTNSGVYSISDNSNNFDVDLNTYLTGILETTDSYLKNQSMIAREIIKEDIDWDTCEYSGSYDKATNSVSKYSTSSYEADLNALLDQCKEEKKNRH